MKNDYLDSLFDVLFDHPSIGASINDTDSTFLRVNKKFCQIIGYEESEILGKTPFDFTLDEDQDLSKRFHTAIKNQDLPAGDYEKRYIRKDGSIIWVKIIAKIISHPQYPNKKIMMALIEDISSQKAVQTQAELNQFQLNTILETAVLGVWCVDSNWQVTYSNRALQEMLGYSQKELQKINLRQITHKEDLVDTNGRFDQTKPGQNYQANRRYLRSDGTYLWVRVSVSKFPAGNDKFYGISIVEDISKQKEAEKTIQGQQVKLISSAKMAALGEMAGGVAHEINNPLAVISGKIQQVTRMLESPTNDIDKIKKYLNQAHETAQRISVIVNGLRSFSREAEQDPWKQVSINEIMKDAKALCQERFKAHNISLEFNNQLDKDELILSRSTQIVQVLISLLSNSFDAIEVLNEKWVTVVISSFENKIKIEVTDSGNGIEEAVVNKMMQPFFTTKAIGKGTGLGLSIAVGIVEDHKGTLSYDPNSKHTRFILEFPKCN